MRKPNGKPTAHIGSGIRWRSWTWGSQIVSGTSQTSNYSSTKLNKKNLCHSLSLISFKNCEQIEHWMVWGEKQSDYVYIIHQTLILKEQTGKENPIFPLPTPLSLDLSNYLISSCLSVSQPPTGPLLCPDRLASKPSSSTIRTSGPRHNTGPSFSPTVPIRARLQPRVWEYQPSVIFTHALYELIRFLTHLNAWSSDDELASVSSLHVIVPESRCWTFYKTFIKRHFTYKYYNMQY